MRRRDPSSWDKGRGQGPGADWSTLRTLFPYLWPPGEPELRLRVVMAMILLVAAKGVGVGIPLLYKQAVDVLSVSPVLVPLALLAAYGAARVMAGSFAELRDIVFVKVAQRAIRKVGLGVFTHLHRLGLRFHLDRQTGGVSRAIERGTKGIEFLLNFMLFNILPTLLEIGLVTAILWGLYDGVFALITAATIAVYIAFTLGVTEWRTKFRRAMNETDSEASTKAIDSLLNFETVKYFCNEAHEAGRYDKALARYEYAASKSKVTLSLLNMGQGAVIAIGLTLVMIRAAEGVADGTMTLGDFVLVNAYLIQLYLPLNFLGFVYREIKQSLTDMESMFRLLRENAEIEDSPGSKPLALAGGEVRFDGVTFGYNPDRRILGGVDFTIPAGNTLAIVGPSGAGKSTLSRLLFRFYDVNGGAILIDGQDIRQVTQGSLRAAIGIVPQDTVLFNDTIRYNIAYGRPGAAQDEVEEAARLARIHDFVQSLPQGYDTRVGERGLKLSGGEKQRVAIARTILKRPSILIFDEATSALDTQTEKEIQESLREVSRDRTTLIVAHRLSTVVDADEIVVLDGGRIVERGRHAQLLEAGGHYAAMWRRQQEAQTLQQRLATELQGAE
ncbi:ABC-type transport system involved in Fe-S cluster assembly, permease and ATPase component protein [Paramagnetospirillum caucaseum]|uniref:ABC-type transport system involved in Fe-S cluster assembly, permease and ATPase component protein n=1 Tax=Paramagnetospirillum caucaseum TaxID=1244869 RepID=M2Z734_9PROT|nr:ABC transporter ATP-binding protein/permease [Paramagnetospirillum caucaseum]EME70110.1 ABC-type transport system involved in Fe-S cluster assembly, permease and ATPase component protein [Paramagnetospirillum caucaseum]